MTKNFLLFLGLAFLSRPLFAQAQNQFESELQMLETQNKIQDEAQMNRVEALSKQDPYEAQTLSDSVTTTNAAPMSSADTNESKIEKITPRSTKPQQKIRRIPSR